MKTTIAYAVFLFFEGIYFWRPSSFECLILEIYNKYNLWAMVLNGILHFGFTILFKKWKKEKKKMTPFWGKNTEEK